MSYKVISRFEDKKDNRRLYEVGDTFPADDSTVKVTKGRLKELSSNNNRRKRPLIAFVEETNNDDSTTEASGDDDATDTK